MQLEGAIADEVLAEVARKHLTATAVQRAAKVSPASWGNYFVAQSRKIPLPVLLRVCDALGVLPEDIIRLARERAAREDGTLELLAGLTGRQRRIVRQIRSVTGD